MKYNGLIVVEKIFFNVYMYKRKRHVAGDFDNKDKVQREKQEEEEVWRGSKWFDIFGWGGGK